MTHMECGSSRDVVDGQEHEGGRVHRGLAQWCKPIHSIASVADYTTYFTRADCEVEGGSAEGAGNPEDLLPPARSRSGLANVVRSAEQKLELWKVAKQ